MPYRIVVSRRAERDLERIDARYARRLRVGDYRALFIIDDDTQAVHVRRCGHRTDIYRRL